MNYKKRENMLLNEYQVSKSSKKGFYFLCVAKKLKDITNHSQKTGTDIFTIAYAI